MRILFLCGVACCWPHMAVAQAEPAADSFAGAYAGAEAGAVDHHFVIETTGPAGSSQRNVTQWGFGAGAFGGGMIVISPNLLVGGELGLYAGGRAPRYATAAASETLKPQWGFSATARLGWVAAPRTMLFVEGGYGGHKYRETAINIAPAGAWNRSFVLGAGVEYRLTGRVRIRARFQHLDGTRNQFLLGLPIRF